MNYAKLAKGLLDTPMQETPADYGPLLDNVIADAGGVPNTGLSLHMLLDAMKQIPTAYETLTPEEWRAEVDSMLSDRTDAIAYPVDFIEALMDKLSLRAAEAKAIVNEWDRHNCLF